MIDQQFPDDNSTVISIAPFGVNAFKPGLYPGSFIVPPCYDENKPARLLVGSSHYILHVAGRKQGVAIVTPSFEIANSIVLDYLDGQLFSEPNAHPGICWVKDDVSVEDFKKQHSEKLKEMQEIQRRWFVLLVKKTQDDWNKYHNSRVVSDQARFAVRALDLEMPEWMTVDSMGTVPTKCPACGTVNDPSNAWCVNCIQGGVKVPINQMKFDALSAQLVGAATAK